MPVPVAVTRETLLHNCAQTRTARDEDRGSPEGNALRTALENVSNAVRPWAEQLETARSHLPAKCQRLREAYRQTRNIDPDTVLRLKNGRFKPLPSSSTWKNLTGYGASTRLAQVTAMATTFDGATTRSGLLRALDATVAHDGSLINAQLVLAKAELRPLLEKVETLALQGDDAAGRTPEVQARAEQALEGLRAHALKAAGKHGVDLSDWSSDYLNDVLARRAVAV